MKTVMFIFKKISLIDAYLNMPLFKVQKRGFKVQNHYKLQIPEQTG